jgi:hypothetical protein
MADGKIAGGRITGEERFSCVGRAFFHALIISLRVKVAVVSEPHGPQGDHSQSQRLLF